MKKLLSLLLMLSLLAACVPAMADADWVNSNIIGNVTAETEVSLKDDFHLAINHDWLANVTIPDGYLQATSFTERNAEVTAQILSLLNGDDQPSHDGQLAQRFYRDCMDMDRRNELGMSPVLPYLQEIEKIQTLDELTAYMQREDQLFNVCYSTQIMADLMDSEHNALYLGSASLLLGDADEYKSLTSVGARKKEALTTLLQKLLVRAGYTEADAQTILERNLALETEMASVSLGSSDAKQADYFSRIYNPVATEELAALSPTFPILTFLKDYTDAGVERVILTEKDWLAKMNELYVPERLDEFKAYLLCNTVRAAATYLDQACIDLCDEANSAVAGMEVHSVLSDTALTLCSGQLGMAIGRMYAENFVSDKTKQEITDVIHSVVDIYKQRLTNAEWLGEETRAKAIEKLDHLRIRVAYPDDWSKYDLSDVTFIEGGTLLDDVMTLGLHSYHQHLKDAASPVDHDKWSMNPQTVNAYYLLTDNSINILAGILGGVFYDPEGSIEQTLGAIGTVIGHEITHGFDTKGSQYDLDGNMLNWWTDADRAAFTERTDKVNAYYGAIEVLPGKNVDGQLTIGETVADLGGMSSMLELAKTYENFDYDLFFRSYARLWAEYETAEIEEILLTDAHAPGYLRTNVTLQQFAEFYDTYGITEGDGMYLAPEKRLSVW